MKKNKSFKTFNIITLLFIAAALASCGSKDNLSTISPINPPTETRPSIEPRPIISNTPWLTQLGAHTNAPGGDSSEVDSCSGVSVDSSGNVYCAGYTTGDLGETNGGSRDAFIMKLDSSGNLQWVTQLGALTTTPKGDNSELDACNDITVDSSGNVYCAGETRGALGEGNGGNSDAFIMKLNSDGALQWVTQLGDTTTDPRGSNSGDETCFGVSVDDSGNIYCTGTTDGALSEANGGNYDAFVMKLNSDGALQWVTQLGAKTTPSVGDSSENDICYGVSVDSSGNIYCAGYTSGNLGEGHGGGYRDAFVMKLNSDGALQWVTQLGAITTAPGGNNLGADTCLGVSVDTSGNVYCAGSTNGDLGETNGGGDDAFIMKLNSDGILQWVTQLGASTIDTDNYAGTDLCTGVNVDSSGNVYCAGYTRGNLGEPHDSDSDAFVMKLNTDGDLQWITQLGYITTAPGGANYEDDKCLGVSVDTSGNVYCAGTTDGPLGEANGGDYDAFIMKLNSDGNINP